MILRGVRHILRFLMDIRFIHLDFGVYSCLYKGRVRNSCLGANGWDSFVGLGKGFMYFGELAHSW